MKLLVLLKKEYLEYLRNKKLISILLIFIFFGIMSPLTAYFIPDIMDYVTKTQNIKIEIPSPTYQDAIFQYIKNISQMCVFVLILMNMGIVSNEKEKGTAIFVLVKPVNRKAFIISKFIAVLSITAIAVVASAIFAGFYTKLFFDQIPIAIFTIQNLLLILYISTILSITIMFSTISKSQILAGILSFFIWISFSLLSQLGEIGKLSPDNLINIASSLTKLNSINSGTIITCMIIIIISMSIAIFSFEKWEPR